MNSIIEMNQLKRFLKNEIQSVDPSIIETLQQYDTIQVDSTMYQTADVIKRIKEQGCPHCMTLKREVTALRYQLKKVSAKEGPPMNLLLEKFFQKVFQRIREREYSRKELFKEVNIYLKQFNLQIMYNTGGYFDQTVRLIMSTKNPKNSAPKRIATTNEITCMDFFEINTMYRISE